MKISITARLFLAVLAIAAFAVLAMGMAAHFSYTRGFIGYLNEQAMLRMEAAVPRLARAYAANGSWGFVQGNRPEWFRILRVPADAASVPAGAAPSGGRAPPQVSDLTGALLRFTLLDDQERFVVGYGAVDGDSVRREIVVGGERVGWLLMAPFQTVSGGGDQRFERHQIRASWAIGAVCVLLSAVIALWVARRLLRPVRSVAQATHRLAAGEYGSRVQVESDDEVGQLARDFNTLADTLERNERMRRDFLADVSHELRTPLGVLHGELEAIEDGVHAMSPATVKSLQAEVATMNKLVSDLYDLSLADVGALTYRKAPVDIVALLCTTLDGFTARLAEAGLTLRTELPAEPPMVLADERRLQQLFNNLMENSVRYTDRGGVLQVRVSSPAGAQAVQLEFEDSAPGVPAHRVTRLFDRFYRVEGSRNRASGGAGLGLAICRSIVAAHGGRIEAGASPLGGLAMRVVLPASGEAAA
ncbi:sensor histidine kinase efflux regulator BaeS [Aquincola sp. J276]|uniref:sensor histidine kinase efflux regulator BaeS n=1 Tax=Aquincola sp. J276 TaxID=2898432 RepID=UPI00215171F0|nr:sensor histidine kinase efflux regulator BaeS [Aquincola sp. J276]MCR5863698.1 sensor histidine kinase efflux regulator BaeS [Aquincola sp. J276]